MDTTSKPEQPASAESIMAFGLKPELCPPCSGLVSINTVLPFGLSDSNCMLPFQWVVTLFIIVTDLSYEFLKCGNTKVHPVKNDKKTKIAFCILGTYNFRHYI